MVRRQSCQMAADRWPALEPKSRLPRKSKSQKESGLAVAQTTTGSLLSSFATLRMANRQALPVQAHAADRDLVQWRTVERSRDLKGRLNSVDRLILRKHKYHGNV